MKIFAYFDYHIFLFKKHINSLTFCAACFFRGDGQHYWLRAVFTILFDILRCLLSRILMASGRFGLRAASKRSSTAVDTLFTFCPPGPPERMNCSVSSQSSIVISSVILSIGSDILSDAPRMKTLSKGPYLSGRDVASPLIPGAMWGRVFVPAVSIRAYSSISGDVRWLTKRRALVGIRARCCWRHRSARASEYYPDMAKVKIDARA